MKATSVLYIPDRSAVYRMAFLNELVAREPTLTVTIAADIEPGPDGVPVFGPEDIDGRSFNWISIKNIYLRRKCVFQRGLLYAAMKSQYEVLVLWGEAHRLSSWLAAFVAKVRHKPLIIWGHGIYGRESWAIKKVRAMFYNQASLNFTYGFHGLNEMQRAGVRQPIQVIYNALVSERDRKRLIDASPDDLEVRQVGTCERPLKLIFIGRLIASKKLEQLAIIDPGTICQGNVTATIVGEGPEHLRLEQLFNERWSGKIYFKPAIKDFLEAAQIIQSHDIFISPGNIGLAAMHSLLAGTPVITHGDAKNQMPEYEVIRDGFNGALFERDSSLDLQVKINDCADALNIGRMNPRDCKRSTERYSARNQVNIFIESLSALGLLEQNK